jgi:hypothetical protein
MLDWVGARDGHLSALVRQLAIGRCVPRILKIAPPRASTFPLRHVYQIGLLFDVFIG